LKSANKKATKMERLAPEIMRQRLLIEGYFEKDVDEKTIETYFETLTKTLELRAYGKPIIFSPGGMGKEENQGYDAFVPLIDSGIALYVWSKARFLSAVIYTCKAFDEEKAIETTRTFFRMKRLAHQIF